MTPITKSEFAKLYDLLKLKLIADERKNNPDYKLPEEDVEIIGATAKYAKHPSIYMMMLKSKEVTNFLDKHRNKDGNKKKISASHLYGICRHFRESNEDFRLTAIYEHIYFILIGCENKQEFRNSYFPTFHKSVTYHCLYYSVRKLEIFNFSLTLEQEGGLISARSQGFHDEAPELELRGDFRVIGDCYYAFVSEGNYYLNFNIHGSNPKDPAFFGGLPATPFMLGVVSGISSYSYPLSFECLFLSEAYYKDPKEVSWARQYLFLKRNYKRVRCRDGEVNSIRQLEINHVPIDKAAHIKNKTYKIWTYSVDMLSILQSKFHIDDMYKSTIEVPEYGAQPDQSGAARSAENMVYNCFISFPKEALNQMVVTAYIRMSLKIFTVIRIPSPTKPITNGVFVSLGHEGPVTNHFVMRLADDKITGRIIPIEELGADQSLIEMKKELDEIHQLRMKRCQEKKNKG